jgi:GT2 family glycosyltransferase
MSGTWRFRRTPPDRTSVSAIVPFRDGAAFLRTCTDSVTATTGDVDLQFVLVDNSSVEPETLSLLDRLDARDDVTVLRDDRSFNWAALNNAAVDAAQGDVLLFLNNDIEARHRGWMGILAAQALRPDVAAVGARLLYPGGRVQHSGVVIGIGAAGHTLVGLPADQPGYMGLAVLTRDCSAVTGACMASRRTLFEELGGFDEELGIDTNDIDFCLRARQQGYRVLYEPMAELTHYESPSRGKAGSVPDIRRFMLRWDEQIETGDPFLNRHLTRLDGSCALRQPDEEEQLHQWRLILQGQ